MVQYVPEDAKRILEIGCGETLASLQREVRRRGVARVSEYVPLIQVARNETGPRICGRCSNLPEWTTSPVFWCHSFCNDVLGNLTDPYSVLLQLKSKAWQMVSWSVLAEYPVLQDFSLFRGSIRIGSTPNNGIMDKTHYRFLPSRVSPPCMNDWGMRCCFIRN